MSRRRVLRRYSLRWEPKEQRQQLPNWRKLHSHRKVRYVSVTGIWGISVSTILARIRHFQKSIPTIPTIPRYFEISVPTILAISGIFKCHTDDTHDTPVFRDFGTYHAGEIKYFQMTHLRYPRVPRYTGHGTLPTVPM